MAAEKAEMNFRSALVMTATLMIISLGADGARLITRAPAPAPHATTDTDTTLTLLKWMGYIASGLVYLAPLLTFRLICRERTTAGQDSTLYVVSLFSYSIWAYYGVLRGSVVLMVNNFLGIAFQTGYIVTFFRYSDIPARRRVVYMISTVGVVCIAIFAGTHSIQSSFGDVIVGWIGVAGSVMLSASSIPSVRRGWRDRTVEHIQLRMICVTGLSHVPWAVYAWVASTVPLMYPRLFGLFLGAVQVIVYVVILCRGSATTERILLHTVELTPPETSEQTLPETSEQTLPETSEQTLPETSEQTRPETSEQTLSETSEQTLPETSEQTLSETSEQTLPETSEQTRPETSDSTPSETSEPPPPTT